MTWLAWQERAFGGSNKPKFGHSVDKCIRVSDPAARLAAVLEAYALMSRSSQGHDSELAALLHRNEQVSQARQQFQGMVADLVRQAAMIGAVRDDAAPDELAIYCLHALTAAGDLPSDAAVRRLVTIILDGLAGPVRP